MWHTGSAAAPTWNQDPEWHSRRAKKSPPNHKCGTLGHNNGLKNMWLDSSHLRHPQQCIKYLLKYFGPSNGLFDKLFFPGIKLSTITRVEGVWVFLTILDLKTNYSKMLFRLSEAWPFCRKGHFLDHSKGLFYKFSLNRPTQAGMWLRTQQRFNIQDENG